MQGTTLPITFIIITGFDNGMLLVSDPMYYISCRCGPEKDTPHKVKYCSNRLLYQTRVVVNSPSEELLGVQAFNPTLLKHTSQLIKVLLSS